MDVPEEDTNSPGWVFKSEGGSCVRPGERCVGRRGAAVSARVGTAGQGCSGRPAKLTLGRVSGHAGR